MDQPVKFKSLVPTNKSVDFPRMTAFFDGTVYFVERFGDLLEELGRLLFKSKLLIAGLALVIMLIIDFYIVIKFLLLGVH